MLRSNINSIERAHEETTLAANIDAIQSADALAHFTFTELLEEKDRASEECAWRHLSDIEVELRCRREVASARLRAIFTDACETHASLPWVVRGQLGCVLLSTYLTECAGTNQGTDDLVHCLMWPQGRARVIARLALEYAKDNCADLLRAGFTGAA